VPWRGDVVAAGQASLLVVDTEHQVAVDDGADVVEGRSGSKPK
jgi:hypothetical protein